MRYLQKIGIGDGNIYRNILFTLPWGSSATISHFRTRVYKGLLISPMGTVAMHFSLESVLPGIQQVFSDIH